VDGGSKKTFTRKTKREESFFSATGSGMKSNGNDI